MGSETEPAPVERYDLGLCLSGGGYRAMLFHAGALMRMNDAGLLARLDMVSSVSGGSIAAGLLAVVWPNLNFENGVASNFREVFLNRVLTFSRVLVDVPCIVKGLLNPFSTAAEELAAAYEKHLFDGLKPTLKSLTKRPWFVFCSSNLSTGSLFRMSHRYIADYRIGVAYDADLPVATAVAASSAFPPVLSPLRLDLKRFDWVQGNLDSTVGSPVLPGRAVLTDGGVYDNHGIEPVLKRCRWVLVSDGGAPWQASSSGFYNWFSQLRRVFDTTDNQVRALRRRDIIARFKAGQEADELGLPLGATMRERAAVRGVYWSIGLNPSRYPAQQTVAFTPTSTTRPADIQTYLRSPGERETADLVNWGYAASDVALRSHYAPPPAPVSTLPVAADVAG